MKNKIMWVITAVLGLMLVMQQLQASQGVDVRTAQSMSQQGALLLDVREPSEYAAVHAVDAKLMPLGQVGMRLKELEAYKDKPVAVICRSGRRSAQAVSILQEAGFSKVVNVQGGTNAWVEAGLEVVAPN
ncbi:MAG: rhodanese-like domain-containing protein [Gammaproteobacteria bacterium]|nr:rhodanese-like domain-containing protein [Gammaproteobacteria bacterium]MBU1624703.1 rhodanese-like domain-containing protein [Gammaproteobacteria bacterium]MBU1982547.1 rhodanese-like domain-containing protein [Gammaproteobacteria bacterium]